MLHCQEFKEYDDHPEDPLYMQYKDPKTGEEDWYKVPI